MNTNWQTKKLGEICEIIGGGTPAKSNTIFYTGDIPWATVRDMKSQILRDTEYKITKEAIKNSSTNIIPKGNVIIATRVGLGKVCILKQDTAINQDLKGIIPKNSNLLRSFLFLWFKTVTSSIESAGTGATVKGVKLDFIKSLDIPLPSIEEQKRIVAVLDEVFEKIETAKKNTEKNLQNSRELFEICLQNIFEQDTSNWSICKLIDMTTKIGSGATPLGGKNSYHEQGISLIRSLNVYDQEFQMQKLAFLNVLQAKKLSNVIVEENDILLNITGASIARCCIVPKKILPARVNQHVSIIRVNKNVLLPEFLHFALISKKYKDTLLLTGEKGGSTRQALTKSQLENLLVTFPNNLYEQKKIVNRVDELSEQTKRLEESYKKKLAYLEELKKAVLEKAFSGEL